MTQLNKLVNRLIKNPTSLSYAEIKKILHATGFELERARGSHFHFKHASAPLITIVVHGNECKNVYKKKVSKVLQEYKIIPI